MGRRQALRSVTVASSAGESGDSQGEDASHASRKFTKKSVGFKNAKTRVTQVLPSEADVEGPRASKLKLKAGKASIKLLQRGSNVRKSGLYKHSNHDMSHSPSGASLRKGHRRSVIWAHRPGEHETIEVEQRHDQHHDEQHVHPLYHAHEKAEQEAANVAKLLKKKTWLPVVLPLSTSGRNIHDLRITIEVYQGLLQLEELVQRPSHWKPEEGGRQRPYVQYLQKAIRKVIAATKPRVSQDVAQRGVITWMTAHYDAMGIAQQKDKLQPKTQEEIIDDISQTQFFWDQMRSAHVRGLKTDATGKVPSKASEGPASPTRKQMAEMLSNTVDTLGSDALRDDIRVKCHQLQHTEQKKKSELHKLFAKQEEMEIKLQMLPKRRNSAFSKTQFSTGTYIVKNIAFPSNATHRLSPPTSPGPWFSSKRGSSTPRPGRRVVILGCGRGSQSLWDDTNANEDAQHTSIAATAISTPDPTIAPRQSVPSDTIVTRLPSMTPQNAAFGLQEDLRHSQSSPTSSARFGSEDAMAIDQDTQTSHPEPTILAKAEPVACWGEGSLSAKTESGVSTRMVAEYLKADTNCQTVPTKQAVFVTQDGSITDFAGQSLNDERFNSIVPALKARLDNSKLEGIDLRDNVIVDALSTFIAGISPSRRLQHATFRLTWLNLSNNPLSTSSLRSLAEALRMGRLKVHRLQLCSVPFTAEGLEHLCSAVVDSDAVVEMELADIQCGHHRQDTCTILAQLCLAVKKLDVSQNFFRGEGLAALGKCLASSRATVETLLLSENTCGGHASFDKRSTKGSSPLESHPMCNFFELVGLNSSLQTLDVSGCQVDAEPAICLEDSLAVHPCLENLDVSRNPLGVDGLRAILRALADPHGRLTHLIAGEVRSSKASSKFPYDPFRLHAVYRDDKALNLVNPYHRSLLRMLLRCASSFQSKPQDAVQNFMLNEQSKSLKWERDAHGRHTVPMRGIAEFDFNVDTAEADHSSASDSVIHWHRRHHFPVGLVKFVAVLHLWIQLNGKDKKDAPKTTLSTDDETKLFLVAATKDLSYTPAQVKLLLREVMRFTPVLVPDVALYFATTLEQVDRGFCVSAFRHSEVYLGEKSASFQKRQELSTSKAYHNMSVLVRLNLDSLTGRHDFNLSLPTDYVAAHRAILAAKWETEIARREQLLDLTELGEYVGFRNLTLDGSSFQYSREWSLESTGCKGHLVFDYVTPLLRRPGPKAKPMPEAHFKQLLSFANGAGTDMTVEARFQSLWSMAHRFWVDGEQLEELVDVMTGYRVKTSWCMELYIVLFPRCIEFGARLNDCFKGVLSLGVHFNKNDLQVIRRRLGFGNTFDMMNVHKPSINRMSFDLAKKDEHQCFCAILLLSQEEEGCELQECNFSEIAGLCQLVSWSIPASWIEKPPKKGIVSFRYTCQPQFVQTRARIDLAHEWLGWTD